MPDQNNETKVNARAIRDFNDAGTEKSFTKDSTFELPKGTFDNYAAAGLVEKASEAQPTTGTPPSVPAPVR